MLKRVSLVMMALFTIGAAAAQQPTVLACGDTVSGQAPATYPIVLDAGSRLVAQAGPLAPGTLTVELIDINAFVLESRSSELSTVETDELTRSGIYDVAVDGTPGTPFQLLVSCIEPDGTLTTNNNRVQPLMCGGQAGNTFTLSDTLHRYYVPLSAGDALTVNASALDSPMALQTQVYAPDGSELNTPAPQDGVYRVTVSAAESGTYRIGAACTLANGQRVGPEDSTPPVLEPTLLDMPTFEAQAAASTPAFSAQAAPPVAASTVADIVLQLEPGAPNNGVMTPDFDGVYAFQFEAAQGDTLMLDVERVSGNMQIGVVIASDLEPVLFQASLIASRTLSTEFSVPVDGTYTVRIAPLGSTISPRPTAFSVLLSPMP